MTQARILAWAIRTFGEVARNRHERACRVAEEAIELAQCEGVSIETIQKIAERVYSRPAGFVRTEVADVGIALSACAENADISLSHAIVERFQELEDRPAEHWRAKHDAKVEAGTAIPRD